MKIPLVFWLVLSGLGIVCASRVGAQTFRVLWTADGTNGAYPQGLVRSHNAIYGTANSVVFKINTDGTGFEILHHFVGGNNDGASPSAGLVLSGNTLYGTTYGGGRSGAGIVFALSTDGAVFENLHDFNGSGGANPQATLISLSNRLYGTTMNGGTAGAGTVFAVNSDGTGFTNLHSFSDGGRPTAGLVFSGGTLYGTTSHGGNGYGAVFALKTDGSSFTNLYSFTGGTDGAEPRCGLSLSDNVLYGATFYTAFGGGFSAGSGTVFAINTDGTGFTTLHTFDPYQRTLLSPPYTACNDDGMFPNSLMLSGNKLYGTASAGGGWGFGTIFGLNTDGTGFQVLYHLAYYYSVGTPTGSFNTNTDGIGPNALSLSGHTLYGTANTGGVLADGTVFSLSLPLPQLSVIHSNNNLVLSWSTDFGGYTLQSATSLASSTWTTNLPSPAVVNGQFTVTNPISGTQQFFRLAQ